LEGIDGLIFDCDGTLTHSMPLHFEAWSLTANKYGLLLDETRFYALAGIPSQRIIAMLAEEQSKLIDDPMAMAKEKEMAFYDLLHRLESIPPVLEIAREYRGKKRMAVASGGWRDVVRRQLEMIGCLDWFDTIVTAEDTEKHKPDPDVFLEAAKRLGVPAHRCMVYEDADLGIEAARRAGMQWTDVRPIHATYLAGVIR
jgi:HAD superfamily hydrolase (TIGR01509 family)